MVLLLTKSKFETNLEKSGGKHLLVQPRESKLRTKDNAQAHKSSSEFEIAALFQIIKEQQFQIQSYFYELEHYPPS